MMPQGKSFLVIGAIVLILNIAEAKLKVGKPEVDFKKSDIALYYIIVL